MPKETLTQETPGRSRDGLYEPALADSEREAVSDLLGYLENVCYQSSRNMMAIIDDI